MLLISCPIRNRQTICASVFTMNLWSSNRCWRMPVKWYGQLTPEKNDGVYPHGSILTLWDVSGNSHWCERNQHEHERKTATNGRRLRARLQRGTGPGIFNPGTAPGMQGMGRKERLQGCQGISRRGLLRIPESREARIVQVDAVGRGFEEAHVRR